MLLGILTLYLSHNVKLYLEKKIEPKKDYTKSSIKTHVNIFITHVQIFDGCDLTSICVLILFTLLLWLHETSNV